MSELENILEAQMKLLGLPAPRKEFLFHPTRKWRFDFCWDSVKFAVEVEGGAFSGGRHTRGTGFEGDLEKYHEAMRLGWTVYRCGAKLIKTGNAVNLIEAMLYTKGLSNDKR